jgi:hypothetical protein
MESDQSPQQNNNDAAKLRFINALRAISDPKFARKYYTENLYKMIDEIDPKEEISEKNRLYVLHQAKSYIEDGADVNVRITREHEYRLLHICAQKGLFDVMKLLLDNGADANAPNKHWQRPLRDVAIFPAEIGSPTEKKKIELIRLLLRNGANPFIKDKANNSDYFYLENYYPVVIEEMFPSSATWTEDQKIARTQSLWLVDFCNGDVKPYLKDEPDSPALVERLKKFNRLYDKDGSYAGQRSTDDLIYWVQDMFSHMTKSMYYAPLLKEYGHYQGAHDHLLGKAPPLIIDLKTHLTSIFSYLPNKHDDMPDGQFIQTYLSKEFAQANFGEIKKLNIPPASPAKIVECLGDWQDKQYVISSKISNIPKINFSSIITKSIITPHGWTIAPILDSDELQQEAKDLHNCMSGYVTACAYRGAHFFTIRRDPNTPDYVYGISVDSAANIHRFAEPVRYNNLEPNPEDLDIISEDLRWFESSLLNESIPGLKERAKNYYLEIKNKNRSVDPLILEVGYDPLADDGVERSHDAVRTFGQNLHDMVRFRGISLEDRLEKMEMNKRFKNMIEVVGLKPPANT